MIGQSDGWWVEIGSSRHVCYDLTMFKTYTNKKVMLGVVHTTNVFGIG